MHGILKPIIYQPIRHIYKLITDNNYRCLHKLCSEFANYPRFKEITLKFTGSKKKFLVPDIASFLSTYEELFVNKIYKFNTEEKEPIIIDIGSNIGLSILYFKNLYPNAKIVAYEADNRIFTYLKKNVGELDNVELINMAVWDKNTILQFDSEGADGGRVTHDCEHEKINVKAIDIIEVLSKYKKIDFLKIDIEGAERVVLPRCKNQLAKVERIFLEYHSEISENQCLAEITEILSSAGFRMYFNEVNMPIEPFINKKRTGNFDFQVNIFAIREEL